MRKIFTSVMVLLINISVQSQISITQADFPTASTDLGWIAGVPDSAGMNKFLGSGANPQVYDLRNITNFVYTDAQFFDPSVVAGFAAYHPTSNMMTIDVDVVTTPGDTAYTFLFLRSSATALELVGITMFADTSGDAMEDTLHLPINPPQLIISTNFDSVGYSEIDSSGFTINALSGYFKYTNYVIKNFLVEGYGKLYSAIDTFDVIKVKVIEREVETQDTNGVLESFVETYDYYYQFFANGIGYPAAEIYMNSMFDSISRIEYAVPNSNQISLNQSDFPAPGLNIKNYSIRIDSTDTAFYNSAGLPMFYLGENGANGTYDFSNLRFLGSKYDSSNLNFTYPDQSPFGLEYPGSNVGVLAEEEKDSLGNLIMKMFLYMKSSQDAIDITGWSVILDSADVDGDSNVVVASGVLDTAHAVNINPLSFAKTDFMLGYNYIDTTSLNIELFNGNFSHYFSKINNTTVDGYGTLLTPMGTYQVLRVKLIEYEMEIDTKYGTSDTSFETNYTYDFWTKGIGFPVLSAKMDSTWTSLQDLEFYTSTLSNGDPLCNVSCVWPGDANANLIVNHYDILPLGLHYNDAGPARNYQSVHWMGFEAQDWADTMRNGENLKHADCNGDGAINITDVGALKNNFSFSHNKTSSISVNPANPDLYFEVITPNVAPGTEVEVKIMAGKDSVNLYGLAFEVQLDTSLIEPGTIKLLWDSSWLGKANVDMLVVKNIDQEEGAVMAGCVRNTNTSKNNFGELARIQFTVRADITIDSSSLNIQATTQGGIGVSGDSIPFNGSQDTIIVTGIKNHTYLDYNFKVYPNPSQGSLTFEIFDLNNQKAGISIVNSLGQVVYKREDIKSGKTLIDLTNLPNGIYTLHLLSSRQLLTTKLLLMR